MSASESSPAEPRQNESGGSHSTPADDEKPPVLGSWNRLYALVLILHALIIILFWTLSRTYS